MTPLADKPAARAPRRRDDLAARELEGEVLLYDSSGARAHALNATAARVWELCDGTRTLDEIVDGIREIFDVDKPTARRDVERLLVEFGQRGLLA